MNILLNFLPVYKGGGLQNAINFWNSTLKYDKNNKWICLTRRDSEISKLTKDDNHRIIELSPERNYIFRIIRDNLSIKKYVKVNQIDVIFTIVGPGPIIPKITKVNGWHEPAFVYPDSKYWELVSFKSKLLKKLKYIYSNIALKHANIISVQTETMRQRMIKYKNISKNKIFIVPNGITSFSEKKYITKEHKEQLDSIKDKKKLLVLSEPIPHKNFIFLIQLAKIISDNFIFVLSFTAKTNSYAKSIVNMVENEKLENKFLFIGRVNHTEIRKIYEAIDAVFLPTLLESFSANYVEAMYYKKPIFTSNLDFAREVCGNYAYYFNPQNPESAKNLLNDYFFDPKEKQKIYEKINNNRLINKYPTWEERFKMYYDLIKKAKKING